MFGFLNDIGNYEDRKVGRDEFEWGFISTAEVSDGDKPFETGISHKEFNKGKVIIVEAYDSRSEAEQAHKKWAKKMTEENPQELVDCCNAEVGQLYAGLGGQTVHKRGE